MSTYLESLAAKVPQHADALNKMKDLHQKKYVRRKLKTPLKGVLCRSLALLFEQCTNIDTIHIKDSQTLSEMELIGNV